MSEDEKKDEKKDENDIPGPDEPKISEIQKERKKKGIRHLRAPIEIRIEITKDGQAISGTSRNLAIGGLSFESMESFEIGDAIHVLMYIPINKELELLKVASKVLWIKEDFGAYVVGASYQKFAPGDQKRLREWLLFCVRAAKEGKSYFQ